MISLSANCISYSVLSVTRRLEELQPLYEFCFEGSSFLKVCWGYFLMGKPPLHRSEPCYGYCTPFTSQMTYCLLMVLLNGTHLSFYLPYSIEGWKGIPSVLALMSYSQHWIIRQIRRIAFNHDAHSEVPFLKSFSSFIVIRKRDKESGLWCHFQPKIVTCLPLTSQLSVIAIFVATNPFILFNMAICLSCSRSRFLERFLLLSNADALTGTDSMNAV